MAVTVTPSSASGTPAAQANGFSGTTITFTNLNGGTNFPACKVVLEFVNDQATDPTGFTLGGNTLTKIIDDGSKKTSLWYADVSAGTTDSCSIAGNPGAFDKCGVVCWKVTGAASGAPASTTFLAYGSSFDAAPQGVTITNSSGGAAILGYGCVDNATTQTAAITNVVNTSGDFITRINPGIILGGAYNTTSGSQTMNVSGVGGNFNFALGIVAAAFDAAGGDTLFVGGGIHFI